MFYLCSLDTFPYAGTTTTCESLYMGVPCVTMAGSVHAHNVGVSLLSKVGEGPSFLPFRLMSIWCLSFAWLSKLLRYAQLHLFYMCLLVTVPSPP